MRRNFYLILAVLLTAKVFAQVDVPPLLITEWKCQGIVNSYIEVTNVGSETIDLSDFSLYAVDPWMEIKVFEPDSGKYEWVVKPHQYKMSGELAAGESWMIMNVFDEYLERLEGKPLHNQNWIPMFDAYFHYKEQAASEFLNIPEWQTFGKDSIDMDVSGDSQGPLYLNGGYAGSVLFYHYETDDGLNDSLIADLININKDPDFQGSGVSRQGSFRKSVAGIPEATYTHVMVRKANIKTGSTNWDLARGTDLETSEWLPIPFPVSRKGVYTTMGTHGDFHLDVTAKNPDETIIDLSNNTVTFPWDAMRGDSIIDELNLGDGMAWKYTENPDNPADSAYSNVRNGDILTLYACGNTLEVAELTITVSEPTDKMASAFPKRKQTLNDDEELIWPEWYVYGLTEDDPVIDSITGIPFATRVDTLYKYLVKPEAATWEIVFVDGEERVDLKDGDILKVTSADGSVVKEYYLQVDEYLQNSNSKLSLISWPDVDFDYFWDWTRGDTLPDFEPTKLQYNLTLPAGTSNVPAIQVKPENVNAKVDFKRATSVDGTVEERTTTIHVMAEDDSTETTYSVIFDVAIDDALIQKYVAEPFFSEIEWGQWWGGGFVEICNPGTEELDLSNYMLVKGNDEQELPEAINKDIGIDTEPKNRYNAHYVPGRRFNEDIWDATPGILMEDPAVDPIVKPGELFVIGGMSKHNRPEGTKSWAFKDERLWSVLDIAFFSMELNPWNLDYEMNISNVARMNNANGMFLLRIDNDSVRSGLKPATDPNDYTIIDRFQRGADQEDGSLVIAGRNTMEPDRYAWSCIRKPHIFTGNPERGASFGTNADDSEWIVEHYLDNHTEVTDMRYNTDNIGVHSMDPVTVYISMVSSAVYLVSPGFEGDLSIAGDLSSTTVEQFLAKINKADVNQTLAVVNGSDTLSTTDAIAGGMVLSVTSADGVNTTVYTLVDKPLDGNTTLVAVDGSGLAVEFNGEDGVISGVAIDATIKSLLAGLEKPELATLNVIDESDALIPTMVMNFDSVVVDVNATTGTFLEVVAQNGDVTLYSLDFGAEASDAVLLSNVFEVDQEELLVVDVPEVITVPTLMKYVFASDPEATLEVIDKAGYKREMGHVALDDRIFVTSADGSITNKYVLQFVDMDVTDAFVGVEEFTNNQFRGDLSVYPNPATRNITIEGVELNSNVMIYSTSGRLVLQTKIYNEGQEVIDINLLKEGMYIIQTKTDNIVRTSRFIKK